MYEQPADDVIFEESHVILERADDQVSRLLYRRWQQAAIDQRDPAADEAWQRHMLGSSVDATISQYRQPEARRALLDFSEIVDYLWFGDSAQPFPIGLTTSRGLLREEVVISFDFDRITPGDFSQCAKAVRRQGFDVLQNHRAAIVERQAEPFIRPLVRAMVCNTPGNRLLESFIGELDKIEDQPLTPLRREWYEQQTRQSVRMRWQLDPHDHISTSTHPAAKLELDRQLSRLDTYTEPRRFTVPEEITPREVARRFLWETTQQNATRHDPDNNLLDIRTAGTRKLPLLRITTDRETVNYVPDSIATWLMSTEDVAMPIDAMGRLVTEEMITNLALEVFNSEADTTKTYQQVLADLVNRCTDAFQRELTAFASNPDSGRRQIPRLSTILLTPTNARKDYGPVVFTDRPPAMPPESQELTSRRTLREMLKKASGVIHRRPSHDQAPRVMSYGASATIPASHHGADAELIIEAFDSLKGSPGDRIHLQVPGYELVSIDEADGTYGYRYLADQDPYVYCDVPVPAASKQKLENTYDAMGLENLADALRTNDTLTVAELAWRISQTGKYYFGKESRQIPATQSLEDFTQIVERGNLTMQCSQWSAFLRYSLDSAFGSGHSTIVGGRCIPPSSKHIPYVGHAQTAFTDPRTGQYYILDAMPGGFDLSIMRQMWGTATQTIGQLLSRTTVDAKPPVATSPTPQRSKQTSAIENTRVSREQLLTANTEQAVVHLRMLFGQHERMMPQEQLFELTAKRGSDDIIFKSLVALLASSKDAPDARALVEHTRQHIKALLECEDEQVLQRLDPYRYLTHPWLADTLTDALDEAYRLLDRQ